MLIFISCNTSRSRGNRDRKSRKPKKDVGKTRRHPLFGEIPLVEIYRTDYWGKPYTSISCDPDFAPEMPAGAVRGDVSRQEFCPMCHAPRYFYVDQPKECVQCGCEFVFTAREQKYWFESLHFNFNSVAIRCPACRRQRRTEKALHAQMAAALKGLKEDPHDPWLLLADAEACVRYRQQTGSGDLSRAISSARRAVKAWPEAVEALFWEGLAHALAGREPTARKLLTKFLHQSRSRRGRYRALAREAGELLASLQDA